MRKFDSVLGRSWRNVCGAHVLIWLLLHTPCVYVCGQKNTYKSLNLKSINRETYLLVLQQSRFTNVTAIIGSRYCITRAFKHLPHAVNSPACTDCEQDRLLQIPHVNLTELFHRKEYKKKKHAHCSSETTYTSHIKSRVKEAI